MGDGFALEVIDEIADRCAREVSEGEVSRGDLEATRAMQCKLNIDVDVKKGDGFVPILYLHDRLTNLHSCLQCLL